MVESIEIKNLRGIASGKLEGFTPLTIIVGPNGSGKSTILDAIYIAANPYPGQALSEVSYRHKGTPSPHRWMLRNPSSNREASISVKINNKISNIFIESDNNQIYLSEVKNRRMTVIGSNSIFPDKGNVKSKIIGSNTSSIDKNLTDMYSILEEKGQGGKITETAKMLLPGSIGIKILTDSGTPVLYVSYPDKAIPVALSGDGIHSLMRLGLELSIDDNNLILIEEIETHMHPGAIRTASKLICEAIRRNVQIIMTTHSLELIDAILEEVATPEELNNLSLFMVKLENGELKSARLSGDSIEVQRHTIGADLR